MVVSWWTSVASEARGTDETRLLRSQGHEAELTLADLINLPSRRNTAIMMLLFNISVAKPMRQFNAGVNKAL